MQDNNWLQSSKEIEQIHMLSSHAEVHMRREFFAIFDRGMWLYERAFCYIFATVTSAIHIVVKKK